MSNFQKTPDSMEMPLKKESELDPIEFQKLMRMKRFEM